MALVQALPVCAEPHNQGVGGEARRRHTSGPSPPAAPEPMGSVSSLVTNCPGPYPDHRSGAELGARVRRHTAGTSCLGSESPQDPLLQSILPPKKQSSTASSREQEKEGRNGNYTFLNEEYIDEWNDDGPPAVSPGSDEIKEGSGLNGNMGGPPPRLVPVSGKLERVSSRTVAENQSQQFRSLAVPSMATSHSLLLSPPLVDQNMEKTVLRPTAFKPILSKSRTSMQYLSPRHGVNTSDSQNNLNLLSPTHREVSPSSSDKCSLYSRARNGGGSSGQSCQLSDSERSSLSSLPPYGSGTYIQASIETPAGHLESLKSAAAVGGHSNSDSGRSSSKSTGSGSISGRGQPQSDSGSSGRSPGPMEGYEGVVRDLEDKLRERELELQQLRDNLDENEAAICQVAYISLSLPSFVF